MPQTRLDDSDYDSDNGYDYDPQTTLDSIEHSKTINFQSAPTTRPAGSPARLFVSSFRTVERMEQPPGRNTEIVYRVPAPEGSSLGRQWLGYIRYKGRDGEGTIDIVNCSATLQPKHLDMGGTSKTGDAAQAGAHGEGLKIALLVLMRRPQNHFVRCRSGGFNWIFNFTTSGRLVARLRRMTPAAVARAVDQMQRQMQRPGSLLPLVTLPDHDVQFMIGETRSGRNEWGDKTTRSLVKQSQFEAWTAAALFLHTVGPDTILTTRAAGDLLLAPQFQGKMYLKGLLLKESTEDQSASMTGRQLRYGYNFAFGTTNRERTSVANGGEESRAIIAIWDAVRQEYPEDWPRMAACLSDLLKNEEPEYADVIGAKFMTRQMAETLKAHLLEGELQNKWYYTINEKSESNRLHDVISGLGREGVQLPKAYWDILRQHQLVRTADEEERRRFTSAPFADVPETSFATSLCRLLNGCFRACTQMSGIDFVFVQAGQLSLHLYFSDDDDPHFRIHDRWLSLEGAATELCLSPQIQSQSDILFHAVKNLFSDAAAQVPFDAPIFYDVEQQNIAPEKRRRQEVIHTEQRLLDYTRIQHLTIEPDQTRPALHVSLLTDFGNNEIEIQCHQLSTCGQLMRSFISYEVCHEYMSCMTTIGAEETDLASASANTRCRRTRLSKWNGKHIEENLVTGEEYFFLCSVTPADPGSFVYVSDIYRGPDCAPLEPRDSKPRNATHMDVSPSRPGSPSRSIEIDSDSGLEDSGSGSDIPDNRSQRQQNILPSDIEIENDVASST
ncbi:hypothetical protein Sste5344_008831 [Sporothrix stenoceras]